VVAAGWPAVMVSHWPGFYFQGEEIGFNIFKTVVARVNRLPNILWMKTSEIAHYWLARALAQVTPSADGCRISSPVPCQRFTLRLSPAQAGRWHVNGRPLREVSGPLHLETDAWAADGEGVVLSFDLEAGETSVQRRP